MFLKRVGIRKEWEIAIIHAALPSINVSMPKGHSSRYLRDRFKLSGLHNIYTCEIIFKRGKGRAIRNTPGNCGEHWYLKTHFFFFSSFSIPFLLLLFFFHILFITKPVSYIQGALLHHPNLISLLTCEKQSTDGF